MKKRARDLAAALKGRVRDLATTLVELAGLCLVAYGVSMVYVPAGVIVAGLALVLTGWRLA